MFVLNGSSGSNPNSCQKFCEPGLSRSIALSHCDEVRRSACPMPPSPMNEWMRHLVSKPRNKHWINHPQIGVVYHTETEFHGKKLAYVYGVLAWHFLKQRSTEITKDSIRDPQFCLEIGTSNFDGLSWFLIIFPKIWWPGIEDSGPSWSSFQADPYFLHAQKKIFDGHQCHNILI